jgi:predicted lipoprotein
MRAPALRLLTAVAIVAIWACASSPPPAASSASASDEPAGDEQPRELSEDLWPARVLALLNEHRHAANAPPLAPSSALSEVAAQAARECFDGPRFDEQAVLARAHAQLERQALLFHRVSAVVTLAENPGDAAALEAALDPDARSVGIGVARGKLGESERTAVVLVLGTPRASE